ncbi:tyrosine--tRNA ligase [Limisphaera ngatamarikiensis]|uniref:Tyrosine--tRNA ligase n=1 Tax=Limisphaera ngatamarikiensis TaxID=1324935 RepID=A0A6M1RK33_9BACT|nr:tyrosine--tRNA ligase [Limisphaera ngatamarikiensis]
MNIWQELNWRGLVADCTDPGALQERTRPWTLYCGFDPTADSLHVGHLVPLLALRRFQLFGHHPIAVAGGATGCIGDPSGKSTERPLLSKEQIRANLEAIRPQLARLLDFDCRANPARLVDNADWTAPVTYLDFLRDIGKHFSINQMLAKESVRARLEDRDAGLSYTEFSYMLLQAYDFYVLCRDYGCELQIGGSDQWGNITAGIDLIRKKLGRTAYGLTLPLVTKADGTKFGKTESGSVWLDPRKTSPYRFYQFWINTDDRDVVRYLKYFTFLGQEEISALEAEHQRNPGARTAHRALARAVTELVHGPTATREAIHASEVLFGGNLDGVSESTFREIMDEVPTLHVPRQRLDGEGLLLVDLLVQAGLAPSRSQARKDIEGGGIYVNNVRETQIHRKVQPADLLFGRHLLLRKGRKHYVLVTAE